MQFDARTVRSFRHPHIKIFVPTDLEIQRVVAIVEVSQFWEESQLILGV